MANDPGWYADPWRPGRRRWWDGGQWTDHTYEPDAPVPPESMPSTPMAPITPATTAASPPPSSPPSWQQQWQPVTAWQPVNPAALAQVEIEAERRMAVWAKRAFIGAAVVAVFTQLVVALTFHDYFDQLRTAFDTGRVANTNQPAGNVWIQPLSLVSIAATIIEMIWSHRAMVVARNLRYPSTYGIGWSVAGWIVPIISLWFPYVTVRDLLPVNHPMRRTVGRWWALHLTASVGSFVVLFAGLFSTGVAVALLCPVAICGLFAASTAVRLIDAVLADHTEAVARVTGVR